MTPLAGLSMSRFLWTASISAQVLGSDLEHAAPHQNVPTHYLSAISAVFLCPSSPRW